MAASVGSAVKLLLDPWQGETGGCQMVILRVNFVTLILSGTKGFVLNDVIQVSIYEITILI